MAPSSSAHLALCGALALAAACAEDGRASDTFGPSGDDEAGTGTGTDAGSDESAGSESAGETTGTDTGAELDTGTDGGEPICGDGMVEGEEACDDGVNDGGYGGCNPGCTSIAAHCGDGFVNGGTEQCDDGNGDSSDGCLADCKIPRSCKQILEFDGDAEDGPYTVAPKGVDFPFVTTCDMSTAGGGWTEITLAEICAGNLDAEMTAIEGAGTEGIDEMCRPYTRDGGGDHSYVYDISFPPGFEGLYLSAYVMRANAGATHKSEIYPADFVQTDWNQAFSISPAVGDVSFGSGDDAGPVISYASVLAANVSCQSCETAFPVEGTPYPIGSTSTVLRIGWGESGGEAEGWYPWWSGSVYLR